jgi:hypothetical protein
MALTWDEVADLYGKHFKGRPARTLSMDYVFDKVVSLPEVELQKDGTLEWKDKD